MKKFVFILILSFSLEAFGQNGFQVRATVMDGDTIPYITLNDVYITTKMTRKLRRKIAENEKLIRNVRRTMPYAIICKAKLDKIDHDLAGIRGNQAQKNYMVKAEEELRNEFEEQLKSLSYSQGKLLVKLIDRETGRTPYKLIKEYKSNFNAIFWQSFASIFGMSLNKNYVVEDEQQIEYVIKMLGYD
jgi:hypothetical protein